MFYEFLFLTTSTRYIPMLCISALYLLSTAVTFTIKRRILLPVSKYRMAVNKMAPPMAGVVEKNSPTKSKKSSKRKVDDSRNEDKVTGKNTPNKKSKSNFTDLDFKVQLRDPNTSFSGKHGKTRGSWAFEFRDRFHVELSELLTSSTQFLLEIHNIPAFFTSIRDKLASWIYLNVTRLLGFIAPPWGFATRPVQAILAPKLTSHACALRVCSPPAAIAVTQAISQTLICKALRIDSPSHAQMNKQRHKTWSFCLKYYILSKSNKIQRQVGGIFHLWQFLLDQIAHGRWPGIKKWRHVNKWKPWSFQLHCAVKPYFSVTKWKMHLLNTW